MNITQALEAFQLSPKVTNLYLASLELGVASAKDIAEKADVRRTNFYDLSKELIRLGLLKQVKKGRKRYFQALEPEGLIQLQQKRLRDLELMLPQLKALTNTHGQKPKLSYYEGYAGLQSVYDDMLQYKGDITLFTTPSFVSETRLNLVKEHIPKRIALGNKLRMIGEVSTENIMLQKRDQQELRETRLLPKDLYHSNIELGMYGNKVYFVDYVETFGFIIESNEIAKTLKMIFELVWMSGRIVT